TIAGVTAAYRAAGEGNTADVVLCDPELSAAFRQQCKRLGVPGAAFFWNRVLLRLRKSGRLPKSENKPRRFTFAQMDEYSFASEIALRQLEIDFGLTVDDVLCSPDAVAEFDGIAHEFSPAASTFELRWAALAIRKRSKKSKEIARKKQHDWLSKRLPPAKALNKCDVAKYDRPGTYIFEAPGQRTLYVGEALNVAQRLRLARECRPWEKLELSALRFVPSTADECHGLQSFFVARRTPMLNSKLLYPERS
ncbi:MAG: hypothetical protein R3C10_25190, partial [Pirellulales bacterium]